MSPSRLNKESLGRGYRKYWFELWPEIADQYRLLGAIRDANGTRSIFTLIDFHDFRSDTGDVRSRHPNRAVKALYMMCDDHHELPMPPFRRNHRLHDVVRTSNVNPGAVAAIPDLYPSDGPGINYLITRDLVADVDAVVQREIDKPGLLATTEEFRIPLK
ncbi:hypothetical protein B0H14DRAFT_2597125 [Mycena olivaceomarginata]|nr:hypothetical protein B0H14DRAFT_2597125 [Mycena olivaceomarginata]